MKKITATFLLAFLTLGLSASEAWNNGKYSMFIHFGLYSELGGVWNGKPVRNGYSEQIQSFASISDDDYAAVARQFNPIHFDADSVVLLAKSSGMRSVVITAKHHDGFSMYATQASHFNIVEATPSGRDIVREISEACRRHDVNFGIYFSLVDWNFPFAADKTPHNADIPTEAHHRLNLQQVRELLTNYGTVSELWFDMGSLSAQQSNELYSLVKQLQPGCMVSSRLGNETGDFIVMGDNKLPEHPIGLPWQTAASIYPETWGYRKWQQTEPLEKKIDEKIATLIKVISHGGNYLLNIGPRGDGSITEHEQAVIRGIGEFANRYQDAIYGTKGNPYGHTMPWGEMAAKDSMLYLFVNKYPDDGILRLDGLKSELRTARPYDDSMCLDYIFKGDGVEITLPQPASFDHGWYVMRLTFDSIAELLPPRPQHDTLTPGNAAKTYGVSSLDYYVSHPSAVGYSWTAAPSSHTPRIVFPAFYQGEKIKINGHDIVLDGEPSDISTQTSSNGTLKNETYSLPADNFGGPFRPSSYRAKYKANKTTSRIYQCGEKQSVLYTADFFSDGGNGWQWIRISRADALSVMVNGEIVFAQTMVRRQEKDEIYAKVKMKKGRNKISILWHCRTPQTMRCDVHFLKSEEVDFMQMDLPFLQNQRSVRITNTADKPSNTELAIKYFTIHL